MNILRLIFLTLAQLAKQLWRLPRTVTNVFKQRQRQIILDEDEAERLDRIRNPSKYLGK
jgi:hypothetical protein